tara:strand:- start:989 stop:1843 length:855 start_codon:yes stop_codon:yes gene_type:complete
MPNKQIISKHQLTAGGGTINLDVTEYVDLYILYTSGSVTLTSPYTIQTTGTNQEGDFYKFYYNADLDFDSNAFTVMGVVMPEDIDDHNCIIDAYYDGSAWSVTFTPTFGDVSWITGTMMAAATITSAKYGALSVDRSALAATVVDATKIDTSAVINAKIAPSAVTVDKLGGTLAQEVITIPVSFETGEQSINSFTIPYDCTMSSIRYIVTKAIAATDNATISSTIGGVSTSPATITIVASTVIDTAAVTAYSSAPVSAGDIITMTSAKTTPGGKALITLTLTRT